MTLQTFKLFLAELKLFLAEFDNFLEGYNTFFFLGIALCGFFFLPEGAWREWTTTLGMVGAGFARTAKAVNK